MRRLLILVLCLLCLPARAHLAAAGQGAIRIVGDSAFVVLPVPVAALHGVDDNHDGLLSLSELQAHRELLSMEVTALLSLRSDGQLGRVAFEDLLLSHPGDGGQQGEDQLIVMRRYVWDGAQVGALEVATRIFHADASARTQLALRVLRNEDSEGALLTRERPQHVFYQGAWPALRAFLAAGAEHILIGPDHLLFLLTVLVAGAGWRYWLTVITSFTLAHSLSLAAAALGWVAAPPRIVEPLIALSIVLLALDNLWRGQRAQQQRPWLVFGCGLLHGLGIAGGLIELGLADHNRLASLAGFNLGVELGQLAFVGAALLVLAGLRRLLAVRWHPLLPRMTSLAAAVVGSVWLVQRVLA
ncbi:HupE/UreJ family protein [Massilia sp. TS11]|uniref:HupE/UreJ family protein n=1 Tax=Massilia sp. TS11 TaxID=2908003 RepID=UPI001EDC23A6|nr:HupE/UreJ family protein [Massilia sp. TS11]MCG2586575.1 HupE/UreJ family protein [Massilia sp. TS11]